jgi:hypothetical protein
MTILRKPLILLAALAIIVWVLWPTSPAPLRATAGRYMVEFTLPDPRIGTNILTLDITENGRPATPSGVTIEPVMSQMGHATMPKAVTADAPGRYRISDLDLPMAGQWEITVTVDGDRVVFPLLVNG